MAKNIMDKSPGLMEMDVPVWNSAFASSVLARTRFTGSRSTYVSRSDGRPTRCGASGSVQQS
jgi:hypothetical protein